MNDYWLAIILGVIEGLTEFLPISSTGHMLIAEHILGVDLKGDAFWKLFTVVIQLGAILGVVIFYWGRLGELVVDFFAPVRGKDLAPAGKVPRWRHPLVL